MSTYKVYFPLMIGNRHFVASESFFIGNHCLAKKATKELRDKLGKKATVRRFDGHVNVYRD